MPHLSNCPFPLLWVQNMFKSEEWDRKQYNEKGWEKDEKSKYKRCDKFLASSLTKTLKLWHFDIEYYM